MKIYLAEKEIKKKTRTFIPTQAEIGLIEFLKTLPEQSYEYIPDNDKLILDFEILQENGKQFPEAILVYHEKEFLFSEFRNLFKEEKEFFIKDIFIENKN